MLDVKELTIEGYRSYGPEQRLVFRPGVFLLTGENRDRGKSAGAGKSTIFKALTTALFEQNDDDSVKDAGINTVLKDAGEKIGVSFVADGVHYYVSYSRKHATTGTAWSLYRWDGAAWMETAGAVLGDTKALIESAIRMTYDQFVNNAYIPQYRVAEFIERTDKERKVVFTKLLGLELCDVWIDTTRRLKKESEDQLRNANAKLEVLRSQLLQLEGPAGVGAVGLATELEDLRRQLADDKNIQATEQRKNIEIQGTINAYNAHKAAVERIRWLKQEIDRQGDDQVNRQAALAKIVVPESEEDALIAARTRQIELNYELREAISRSARVGKIGEVCSECEQGFPPDSRDALLARYAATKASLEAELAVINPEIIARGARVTERQETVKRRDAVQGDITVGEKYIESLKAELSNLKSQYGKLPAFDMDAQLAALAAAREADMAASRRVMEAHIRERQILDAQARIATLTTEVRQTDEAAQAVAVRVACLKKTEEAIGDKGFRSYKINSSCDAFNKSLSKYLSLLTNGEMQAWLVTQVPKDKGKGVKQELDILVRDGDKAGVPIRQYSGAEKAALSLSITGAFWDLAASQANCGVNLLLLDEPFANMDDWGKEQACRLFDALRDTDRTVIVITNEPGVRERGRWDGEIRAVKEHHITHLEEHDLSSEH